MLKTLDGIIEKRKCNVLFVKWNLVSQTVYVFSILHKIIVRLCIKKKGRFKRH